MTPADLAVLRDMLLERGLTEAHADMVCRLAAHPEVVGAVMKATALVQPGEWDRRGWAPPVLRALAPGWAEAELAAAHEEANRENNARAQVDWSGVRELPPAERLGVVNELYRGGHISNAQARRLLD